MAMAPNPGRRGSATAQDPSGTATSRGAAHEAVDIPRGPVPHTADIRNQDRPLSETERNLRGSTPLGGVGGDAMDEDSPAARNGGYRAGVAGGRVRPDRGFTMTFAVAAVVLLMALLITLYFGSRDTDTATAPTATQESITENAPANGTSATTPGTVTEPGATTGSTTPAIPPAADSTGTAPTTPSIVTDPAGTTESTTAPAAPPAAESNSTPGNGNTGTATTP